MVCRAIPPPHYGVLSMSQKDVTVAKTNEFVDGEMKQVSANGAEILLARVGGEFHAVGAHCTHYGAPLVEGVLSGDRIVCPWHHACFELRTGNLQEPPALDALPHYEVKVENDRVIVRVPDRPSEIGRAHVLTPVTSLSRMPSSA